MQHRRGAGEDVVGTESAWVSRWPEQRGGGRVGMGRTEGWEGGGGRTVYLEQREVRGAPDRGAVTRMRRSLHTCVSPSHAQI